MICKLQGNAQGRSNFNVMTHAAYDVLVFHISVYDFNKHCLKETKIYTRDLMHVDGLN